MIIDMHAHIGDKFTFHMTEEMVLQAMEKYNIEYTLVSTADAVEVDGNQNLIPEQMQISQEDNLRRALAFARKNEDKIGVAVWVKPLTETLTEELKTLIKENRDIIFALKMHPFHSKISPMDEKVKPYLELAVKYKLPVISHTGGCKEASPAHMYEAAKAYPEIPFVMAHMGLGSDNKEALELLGKADNLYGDTAWVPMETTIEAIRRYGSKKMLFGSDMPIDGVDTYACNEKGERSLYQDYFHVLPEKITEEEYRDLMYRNAIELFGIRK